MTTPMTPATRTRWWNPPNLADLVAEHDMPGMQHHADPVANTPDRHAYVMAGERTLFLCHLTMFALENHSYQVVLRATLPPDAMEAYLADRRAYPTTTYFLANSERDLMTMPDLAAGARSSFLAVVYRGIPDKPEYHHWPWDGVEPIIKDVDLTVDRVVYYRHFDVHHNYPETLTHILFGARDEAHMARYQTREPEVDHVLTLKAIPTWLPPVQLEAGVTVNFPDLRSTPVDCRNPLTEGTHQVRYGGKPATYPIEIGPTLWYSTKIVNTTNPCP